MRTKMKKVKLLAVFSIVAVFMATVSVVYGGLNWTGIDPTITFEEPVEMYGTDTLHVGVIATDGDMSHFCNVNRGRTVRFKIVVPKTRPVASVDDHSYPMPECGGDVIAQVETDTVLKQKGKRDMMKVVVKKMTNRRNAFDAQIVVFSDADGSLVSDCEAGVSNKKMKCLIPLSESDR